MTRDKRIFDVIYDRIEPSSYIKEIMVKANRYTLDGKEWIKALTVQEIKDLCTYHTDPYVMDFKSMGTANRWIKLKEEYENK